MGFMDWLFGGGKKAIHEVAATAGEVAVGVAKDVAVQVLKDKLTATIEGEIQQIMGRMTDTIDAEAGLSPASKAVLSGGLASILRTITAVKDNA